MALHIRDDEADQLVRHLAALEKITLTEAIKVAVRDRLNRKSLAERIRPIQDRIAARPLTGLRADKAFFDSLNDE